MQPVKVLITPEMIAEAAKRAKHIGKLKNSIKKGEGNIIGMLGQMIAQIYYPDAEDHSYNYGYDLLIRDHKYEVKGKAQHVPLTPLPYYEASVESHSMHQIFIAEYWLFTMIYQRTKGKDDYPWGWVVGTYPVMKYLNDSKLYLKGERAPSNGMVFSADTWNLPIGELRDLEEWL